MIRRSVLAALLAAVSLMSHGEPITLKGLAPGMTKAQLEAAHKGFTAVCTKPSSRPNGEVCGYGSNKSSIVDIPALDTFAGAPTKRWLAILSDGVANTITVTMATTQFERVTAAIAEKWGKPAKNEESTVTNRMGAAFDQVELTWYVDDSVLVAKKRSGKVDEMGLYLSTKGMIAELGRERREVQPKRDAQDM